MFEIDLHGLNHKQALIKVEEYLLINSVYKLIDIKRSTTLQEKIIQEILGPHKFDYYIPDNNLGVIYVSDKELI